MPQIDITNGGLNFVMTPDQISWIGGLIAIMVSFVFEKISKKFKPWSWLLNWIGTRINAGLDSKITEIDRRLTHIEASNKAQDGKYDIGQALAARRNIINAADELRRHVEHSEEWFNEILADIKLYNDYCYNHKDFQNEKAVHSIAFISEVYDKLYRENAFV